MSETRYYSPQAIATLMRETGLDVRRTAKAVGLSAPGLEAYLLGRRKDPSVSCMAKLADFFCVPLDYICGRMSLEEVQRVEDGCGAHFRDMKREAYEMYLRAGRNVPSDDAPPIAPWPYNLMEEVLHEEIGDVITEDRMAGLQRALSMLNQRNVAMLVKLYRDERTLADIGAEYGVTKERVRQIAAECVRQLRHRSCRKYIEYGLEAAREADELQKKKFALMRERVEIAEEERALEERRLKLAALREKCDAEDRELRRVYGGEMLDAGSSVEMLDLSVRSRNGLMRGKLPTIGAVVLAAKDGRLQRVAYLGRKSINEIRQQILERAGIDIGDNWR